MYSLSFSLSIFFLFFFFSLALEILVELLFISFPALLSFEVDDSPKNLKHDAVEDPERFTEILLRVDFTSGATSDLLLERLFNGYVWFLHPSVVLS